MEASDGLGLSGPDSPRLFQMIKDEILDGEPVEDGRQEDMTKTHDDHRRINHQQQEAMKVDEDDSEERGAGGGGGGGGGGRGEILEKEEQTDAALAAEAAATTQLELHQHQFLLLEQQQQLQQQQQAVEQDEQQQHNQLDYQHQLPPPPPPPPQEDTTANPPPPEQHQGLTDQHHQQEEDAATAAVKAAVTAITSAATAMMDEKITTGLKRPASDGGMSEEEPATKKHSNEVDKLWKNVNDNPNDFQAWTLLLQHIDQVSDLESGREAYNGFFERYPYCYGYWKKYADLERRKGTWETCGKVFNRGLEAISLSVDLWLHYLEYVMAQFADDEAKVRAEFERAVAACGLEFKSDKMWESYINWESGGKRWKNVTLLYERLLATPTSRYAQHWQRFQEHVRKHMPSEVIGVEEFLSLRREVLAELNRSDIETPDEAPPGVETAPGDDQLGTNVQDEETKLLQKSIIAARQKLHENTATEVKARWSYEDAIKRPYFHVKPLEKSQLSAWRTYLDYEVKQTDDARIRVLFERCLIACAFYEEFWMRYIRYLEENGGTEDEIRSVYNRACVIHLREKFRPHLAWAAFEEEKGNAERALEILEGLQQGNSPSLEAYMQAAGVERRRGNLNGARQVFERCLAILLEEPDKNIHSHVSIKFARFLTMFCRELEKALEVLKEAHEINKENSNVVLAIVDQTLLFDPPRISEAVAALKEGIHTASQPGTQLLFAHRLFHFMSECGQDPGSMSEGLRVLRQVQQEVRQMDTGDTSMAEIDTTGTATKQEESMSGGISVIESRRDKRLNLDKTSPGPVNGTTASANATSLATGAGQSSMVTGYQGYQQQGYGGGYGQGYPAHGYGASHYQNWGYPTQQGNYGYGQQGWGSYGNYYGQR